MPPPLTSWAQCKVRSLVYLGVGSSFTFFPSLAVVGQCFKKKRPLANGILLAGGSLGSVVMPPLLEHSIDTYGFNGACLITAGLVTHSFITASILRTVFITTRKPTNPTATQTPLVAAEINRPKSFFRLNLDVSFVKNSTFVVNGLANAIQSALFYAMVTVLPDLAVEEMGVSRINGAYLISACGFADLTSRLLVGMCLFRVKLRKSILYSVILSISVLDLLLLAYVRNYSVALFGVVVGGICYAFGMVLYCEIVASTVAQEIYPTAFGVSEMIKAPFLLITAATVGSIKDATGSYSTTFLIFAAAQSFALILWIFEIFWNRRRVSKANK